VQADGIKPETEEPELITAEGPDPCEWEEDPGTHEEPSIHRLILDIETLKRAHAALVGGDPAESGRALYPAKRFLATALGQRKGLLAQLILDTYGVPSSEQPPYANAGKPRAFARGAPPPSGNV
jgi:hypothetical protein